MSVSVAATNARRTAKLQTIAADDRGSIAIAFALCLMGMVMFVACAIDYGRGVSGRTKVVAAVDAAAIYAAKQLKSDGMTLSVLEPMARALFDRNMATAGKLVKVTGFTVALTADGNGVVVNVAAEVPTTFASIAGIKKIDVPGTATAVFNAQDIEVALQLDVTGSMGDYIGSQKKITSLKSATNNLLDILLPAGGTGTTKIRVGIAPFSAGVNAGSYASVVAGATAPGNCVYERRSTSANASDDAPSGIDSLKTLNDLSRFAQPCPTSAKVTALTSNKTALTTLVNGLSAGGTTAGHLGTSWAWYLLSPKWSSIWPSASKPADYNDANTRKVAVLMTDGIYNTVEGLSSGDYSATARESQSRAVALCDGMKAQGITIYTVGFIKAGDDPAAADTLKACATGTGYFFKAEDGDQLDAAFRTIAQDISRLRLTH